MNNTYRCMLLLLFIRICYSANILAILTLCSPSHYYWHKGYLLQLIEKDRHNITVLTHEKDLTSYPNYTVITMDDVEEKIKADFGVEDSHNYGPWENIKAMQRSELATCRLDFGTEGLKTLLDYPKDYKFDLIIFDITSGRCLYPLIDKFGRPPVIATCPFGSHHYLTYSFGNHVFSHVPFYTSQKLNVLTFWDRLINMFYVHSSILMRKYILQPIEQAESRAFFGNDIRSIDEYERQFSLLLVNADTVLNYPESFYPNTVPVGGIHIKSPQKLSNDIQAIFDGAKHGVIVVSFGTNIDFNTVDEKIRLSFMEAFAKLQQVILIKSSPLNFKIPKNVIVRKWLPQSDILAHPNVKLIITHGGSLSSQEAMYHGIPIICMPFFLDQYLYAARFEESQLGKKIGINKISTELVHNTILEVLQNPKYKRNMMNLSKRFKDQPQTPMERAIFWTRYVLRHGDASHLNPISRDFNIFQRFELDIGAFLLTVVFTICFVMYKCIACLSRCRNNCKEKLKLKVN